MTVHLKIKFVFFLFIQFIAFTANAQFKEITVEDIWKNYKFYAETFPDIVPLKHSEYYCLTEPDSAYTEEINKYDFRTGEKVATLFNSTQFNSEKKNPPVPIDEFSVSDDESQILIATETESIYRHSSTSKFLIWNINKQILSPLSENGKQRLAEFSPDGNNVCFVRDNNLFIKNIKTGEEMPVTNDGMINQIINGTCDWVYEEEFSFTKGFYWSPDGSKIAYYKFDESKVKKWTMTIYDSLYPTQYKYKYPVAGEDNSIVTIWVYDVLNKTTKKIDIGSDSNQYIPRIKWSKAPDKLAIFRLNRLQNKLEILLADVNSSKSDIIYKEQNKYYIDVTHDYGNKITDILTFLNNNDFLITSEKDGFNHIYLHDNKGTLKRQLTKGNWDVIEVEGIDEENEILYYISSEDSPSERYLYSIKLDGTEKKKISKMKGCNEVEFSNTYKNYINTRSDANTPPYVSINKTNNEEIKTLTDNSNLIKNLQDYNLNKEAFFSFKTSEGTELNGWMIKPPHFKERKKYPVLMYVYGGPGVQTVENSWSYYYVWFQMLAQKGYIIVSVDNRGTGARGEEFKKCTYKHLGMLETEDQIEAAKYLGRLKYVDASRIGIFGWSYGGYLTALCMTKGSEYFKTGVAVAPVTDWKFYDNIYTERYMDLPQTNPKGYEESSVIHYADKLKGKLLIIHGMADDNVHIQNTVELIKELIQKNKQFEMQFYPDKNHGIYGGNTRLHLFTRITEFILKNL